MLTVDVPIRPRRERNIRNGFSRPLRLSIGTKLDAFLNALERGTILETVRTGASGIGRGDRVLKI